MKLTVLALATTCAALALNTAQAANPDNCYWNTGSSGSNKRFFSMVAPAKMELKKVSVGGTLATSSPATIHNEIWQIKCPYPATPRYSGEYYVVGAELVEGYTDVYKTGVAGIGVRVRGTVGNTTYTVPMALGHANADRTYINTIKSVQLEYIRTARDVAQGTAVMNFRIEQDINGWEAAQISVSGSTVLENENYFSGCAGVEMLTVPLGRVAQGEIGKVRKPFNLDVICSGLPAGTQIPVKVYFEGDSNGPGRLNLVPGGAKGVEISLENDSGTLLPFSKGGALSMQWQHSEPGGEVYRLPISAGYARKGSEKPEAGVANATLNYIIDYD
ncbi:type 1 fimbria pilin [Pseudomonas nitritireducens]|uniref:Type 1 fimbria pilin n=1 Tax=Pseudomonas nitroreducens TaxID=46680 RepID=A0A7W7KKL4_PSENT|nr:fimbrial protein [Pseudomonas nitritireducens]MBB4864073.1 type 1 fimbria pilin [Pseudomonas nitritireducens]